MDNKTPVPPYEPNPSYTQGAQQAPLRTADSYTSHPSQPNQVPSISPMQTGATNTYPNQPLGSPPIEAHPQQPAMAHPKGDFYGNEGKQAPMQQVQTTQQQPTQSQYQTAYPLQNLNSTAAPVDCPICHQRAMTRIEYHSGNTTHAWAAVLCACLCLGCIPYLVSGLKDVQHKCGNCGVTLAHWHKSGHVDIHAHA